MMEDMAWAIFTNECNLSGALRRPPSAIGFGAKPSSEPQQFPRDFIDYAVRAGAAKEVDAPAKDGAPASAGVVKAKKGRNRA